MRQVLLKLFWDQLRRADAYRPEQEGLKLKEEARLRLPQLAEAGLLEAAEFEIETPLEQFLETRTLGRGEMSFERSKSRDVAGAICLNPWHHIVIQHKYLRRRASSGGGPHDDSLDGKKRGVETIMSKQRPPCAGLWNTPMVHLNGDLTTCCLDPKLKNRLGNLTEHSLDALWNGPLIHSWRLAQIRGDFDASGPCCVECNWCSAGRYPVELVEAYLENTGELELLDEVRSRKALRDA